MTRVLLTGMSGVGKSSIVRALRELGHTAVDTDHDASRVTDDGEWLWDEPAIERWLSQPDDPLFIVGCASNQVRYYERFDVVILLSAPIDTMLDRVRERTTNPFGGAPEEQAKIAGDKAHVEPMLRRAADREIATDRPLDAVVNEIIDVATTLARGSS